jgi:pyruvate,water dikinase
VDRSCVEATLLGLIVIKVTLRRTLHLAARPPAQEVEMLRKSPTIEWFEKLRRADVPQVGGKNASLGEMVQALAPKGIRIPPGFATTADAYWQYVDSNKLREEIGALVGDWSARRIALAEAGSAIRDLIVQGDWPAELAE